MDYKVNPLPPGSGLDAEDNYTIQVWSHKNGEFLGIALKTAMGGIVHQAWKEAVEMYPGRYLIQTNGPWALRAVTAPSGKADEWGWIREGDICLEDLPQWYGLVARCSCGNMAHIDRHERKLEKWKAFPLHRIAEKLSCKECKRARRQSSQMELGIYKLPR